MRRSKRALEGKTPLAEDIPGNTGEHGSDPIHIISDAKRALHLQIGSILERNYHAAPWNNRIFRALHSRPWAVFLIATALLASFTVAIAWLAYGPGDRNHDARPFVLGVFSAVLAVWFADLLTVQAIRARSRRERRVSLDWVWAAVQTLCCLALGACLGFYSLALPISSTEPNHPVRAEVASERGLDESALVGFSVLTAAAFLVMGALAYARVTLRFYHERAVRGRLSAAEDLLGHEQASVLQGSVCLVWVSMVLGLALMLCVLTASTGDYVRELSIRLSTEVATFARVVGAGDATQLGELKASILSAVAGYPQYDLVYLDGTGVGVNLTLAPLTPLQHRSQAVIYSTDLYGVTVVLGIDRLRSSHVIVSSAVKAALIVACVCIHALLLRVVHRAVFAPLKDSLQGIFLAASFLDDSGHVTSNSTADFDADSVGGDTRKKSLEALNEGSNAVVESIGIHRAVYRLLGLALVALRAHLRGLLADRAQTWRAGNAPGSMGDALVSYLAFSQNPTTSGTLLVRKKVFPRLGTLEWSTMAFDLAELHGAAKAIWFKSRIPDSLCSHKAFSEWAKEILSRHAEKPYHNAWKAVETMHMMYWLITRGGLDRMTPLNMMALLVGALASYVSSPGLSNAFLIAKGDPIAVRFNDSSPLENLAAATVFEVAASSPSRDIFASMSADERREIRRVILKTMLATDGGRRLDFDMELEMMVARNRHWLTKLSRKRIQGDQDSRKDIWWFSSTSMLTLQKSLMRLAQQAPLFKPPEEALQWGFRQTEEVVAELATSEAFGIPAMDFITVAKAEDGCVSLIRTITPQWQLSELESTTAPLVALLSSLLPPIAQDLRDRCIATFVKWVDMHNCTTGTRAVGSVAEGENVPSGTCTPRGVMSPRSGGEMRLVIGELRGNISSPMSGSQNIMKEAQKLRNALRQGSQRNINADRLERFERFIRSGDDVNFEQVFQSRLEPARDHAAGAKPVSVTTAKGRPTGFRKSRVGPDHDVEAGSHGSASRPPVELVQLDLQTRSIRGKANVASTEETRAPTAPTTGQE